MRYVIPLLIAMLTTGCAPEPEPYVAVADVEQLMLRVITPAAAVYWESVGTVMTLEGTEEIAPRTFADWETVRDAAIVIAESGNLLMMDDRKQDDPQWTELSLAMIAAGREAYAAADARDPEAVFTAGGELYVVCNACHAAFAPDAQNSGYRLND